GGTVAMVADGGPLVLNAPTSGAIGTAGEVDDWTFFGRAGQLVTLIANTGSGGTPTPFPPSLNYADVTLLDPAGQVLPAASNSQAGADVKLLAVPLPADGTYQVRVRDLAGQGPDTGNYVLAVWDASVHTNPLSINQTVAGTLGTPFSLDRWTFTA